MRVNLVSNSTNIYRENVVVFDNVSVKFGTHTALENITLNIKDGLFITVVGPNGGGKTTLLKLILGLLEPTAGNILVFGEKPLKNLTQSIGYVPQIKTFDRSFPALPIELVATGLTGKWIGRLSDKQKKLAFEALEQVGAVNLAKKPLGKLSGGELQRIFLARSIIRKPKLLLLDEPASGIDVAGEIDFNNILEDYKKRQNATIIMITHDWEAAFHHSDYVLLLNRVIICYDEPEKAFSEKSLRIAFGHLGHAHEMIFGVKNNA